MRCKILMGIVLAIVFAGTLPAFADEPFVMYACAKGDATVLVATAISVQSFLAGDSYQVAGWHKIEPGECKQVYNSDEAHNNPFYLGVAYLDSHNVLRSDGPRSGENSGGKSYWESFCVRPGELAFQYKTKTKEEAQTCKFGYVLGDFQERLNPATLNFRRLDLQLNPMKNDTSGRALVLPRLTGNVILGDEVHFENGRWRSPKGEPLPDDLIDSESGLPPLAPKWQYSHLEPPVIGYIHQMDQVLESFHTCSTTNFPKSQVSDAAVTLGDNGVVITVSSQSVSTMSGPIKLTNLYAAAIANLDLNKPDVIEQGPGCVSVRLTCQPGSLCALMGGTVGNRASNDLSFWVNSKEQAGIVLDALRKMAAYYPDGAGLIH